MDTLTTIEDKFISAIQNNPNDIDNKRVYADWLIEYGRQDEVHKAKSRCGMGRCGKIK